MTVGETEQGRVWAESRIKSITGGEPIRARLMNRNSFEFVPRFKLVFAGNHRPRLSRVGEAMRRHLTDPIPARLAALKTTPTAELSRSAL